MKNGYWRVCVDRLIEAEYMGTVNDTHQEFDIPYGKGEIFKTEHDAFNFIEDIAILLAEEEFLFSAITLWLKVSDEEFRSVKVFEGLDPGQPSKIPLQDDYLSNLFNYQKQTRNSTLSKIFK